MPAEFTIDSIPMDRLPRHVAIIMDGNGRWAQARGLARIEGHRRGAESVRRVLEACPELGIDTLTLFCFSSENWKRPREELDFLMGLLKEYLIVERPTLAKHGIRLRVIGRLRELPEDVQREIQLSLNESQSNTRLTLCLAINYGSRTEIVDAAKELAKRVYQGQLRWEDIQEDHLSTQLYTADMRDPDLMIRTSGEMRLSNFLLWQLSYSELFITDKAWPDFDRQDLQQAVCAFAKRDRRYGGLST
jgi:undecaprenyl diphosphate synthase